ncbi:MLP-like protein [Drosera capensis]
MGLLTGRLVAEFGLRSSGDLFHDMFSTKPHHISNISPQHIQGCALHEGEFGVPGSVIIWNYAIDGKANVAKEIVEAIDVENKSITFSVIEGDLTKEYKTFKLTIDIVPKGEIDVVKWTIDYEKLHESVPEPIKILEVAIHVTKDIEAHHLKA